MKTLAILLVLWIGLLTPTSAVLAAVSEIPFGGPVMYSIVCTCSESILNYVYDYYSFTSLPLVYMPEYSIFYSNFTIYNFKGLTYHLGTYIPGAGYCSILVYDYCVSLYAIGAYGFSPGTGTSYYTQKLYAIWDTTVKEVKHFLNIPSPRPSG